MTQDTAEIIDLFGVRFNGKRDLSTGRIYVESTPESKAALTRLKEVGREMECNPSLAAHIRHAICFDKNCPVHPK